MATKELKDAAPAAHVAEIVYHGDKLTLPAGMEIPDAITLLKSRQEFLETDVDMSEKYDVFPWDGAYALDKVLTAKFGWTAATATPGFFGPRPPQLVSIDIDVNKRVEVPWGSFSLPGVKGLIQTGVSMAGSRVGFQLSARVKRKDEATIRTIFAEVRKYLKENSIYRGKAIKIRFCDDDGDALAMPEPKFMETGKLLPEHLIYSADVQSSIETNLFTPISRVHDCLANDITVKRGVLLGGPYGTGKTLAATVAATLAVKAGVTYIYVPRADELAKAIEFAKQYQSPASVVFCEDIDRVMDGERDMEMDDILNIIDGIDTKDANIITVLTTNAMRSINPAMLRPGRLDAVIEVTPPDASAVQRLLRLYGGVNVAATTDLSTVGEELAGCIPAVVAEVVKRAKLSQVRLNSPGEPVSLLSSAALLDAAKTMRAQVKLLTDLSAPREPDITVDSTLESVVDRVVRPLLDRMEAADNALKDIRENM
jgi:transitional endoplasmic reticulum ATPase